MADHPRSPLCPDHQHQRDASNMAIADSTTGTSAQSPQLSDAVSDDIFSKPDSGSICATGYLAVPSNSNLMSTYPTDSSLLPTTKGDAGDKPEGITVSEVPHDGRGHTQLDAGINEIADDHTLLTAELENLCVHLTDEQLSRVFLNFFVRSRKPELVDYVPDDFIFYCLNALCSLRSASAVNVMYLLAKSLSCNEHTTDSLSLNFLEMLLLSLSHSDEQELQTHGYSVTEWLNNHSHGLPTVFEFVNSVLFPMGNMRYEYCSEHGIGHRVVLNTASKSTETNELCSDKPDNKHTCADVAVQVNNKKNTAARLKPEKKSRCRCKHCGLKFAAATEARRHENSLSCLTCNFCSVVYKTRGEWQEHIVSHQNKSLFICLMCGKGFKRKMNLLRHQKTVHERIKAFRCQTCGNSFTEKNSLDEHIRIHTGERPYGCDYCTEQFRTRGLFRRHMAFAHNSTVLINSTESRHPCPICNREFLRRKNLENHMRGVHDNIRNFSCFTCAKLFATKSSLEEHCRIHTGDQPFTCDHCDERFRTRSLCRSHIHLKHGAHVFADNDVSATPPASSATAVCPQCGKSFQRKANLQHHVRTVHEGQRPYSCATCGSSFSEKKILQEHIRLHTGEKPFRCGKCPSSFRTAELYRKHIAAAHGFVCDICGGRVSGAAALARHRRLVHPETPGAARSRYPCMQCGKAFMFRYQRERHVQLVHHGMRKFACDTCGKRFATSAHLHEHLPVHHREPRFTCNQCGEGFIHRASYKRHVIRHIGLQQFACPACNKRFDSPDYCRNHMKRVHKMTDANLVRFDMPGSSLPAHLRRRQTGGRRPNRALGSFTAGEATATMCQEMPRQTKQHEEVAKTSQQQQQQQQPAQTVPQQQQQPAQTVPQQQQQQQPSIATGMVPLQLYEQQQQLQPPPPNPPYNQCWDQYSNLHVASSQHPMQQPPPGGQNLQLLQLDSRQEPRVISVPDVPDFMQLTGPMISIQDSNNSGSR